MLCQAAEPPKNFDGIEKLFLVYYRCQSLCAKNKEACILQLGGELTPNCVQDKRFAARESWARRLDGC